jgi:predicted DNA-binding transcriptional regulator YafY
VPKGRPPKKYSQAGRVHDLIRLIESRHGLTIEEMAEETGVARRTVHRDLIAITESGYPLVSEWCEGRKVYRFLTRFRDVPPISFTLQELMALHFLRAEQAAMAGAPFREDLERVFGKIRSVLPPRYAAHLERISSVTVPLLQGRRDYRKSTEILALLRDALLFQYRVTISYRSVGRNEPSPYVVDPYALVSYKGGLYLTGFAHNRNGIRNFAVERVEAVEPSRERFEIPEGFSTGDHFRDAFGIVEEEAMRVQVRFSAAIAHAVAGRIWHPSQEIVEEPDGTVLLSFTAGGKMEIISWLLSYGPMAEVLAPPGLRQEVAEAAAEMAARYNTN